MSREDIYRKLNNKLESPSLSEADVVYILSRVRKLLELDEEKETYSVLNFYCNLALHTRIDGVPPSVRERLIKIKDGVSYDDSIIGFKDFHTEFQKFLRDKNLSNAIYKDDSKIKDLRMKLLSIYSDTPIYLKVEETYKVMMDANGSISFQNETKSK